MLTVLIYAGMAVETAGAAAAAVLLAHRTGWGRRPPDLPDGQSYGAWLAFCSGFWWLGAGYTVWSRWRHSTPTPPAEAAVPEPAAAPVNYTPVTPPKRRVKGQSN